MLVLCIIAFVKGLRCDFEPNDLTRSATEFFQPEAFENE
ncbi:hypothetical protein Z948_3222 [Sulfitobacter donghicola DSW-25 = KCTC 12864 = JCM 14565]|nr:hypothetical protein Z948_3222 [Sulfitobacter donghicola DSW-25 = KCTC 12864 = JCM 14565]